MPDRPKGKMRRPGGEKITQEATAIKKLKAALKEKEILLREIHHRIKNDIQIISSLLRIQAHGSQNPQLKEARAASQSRLRSISLIHEKLGFQIVTELVRQLNGKIDVERTAGTAFRITF